MCIVLFCFCTSIFGVLLCTSCVDFKSEPKRKCFFQWWEALARKQQWLIPPMSCVIDFTLSKAIVAPGSLLKLLCNSTLKMKTITFIYAKVKQNHLIIKGSNDFHTNISFLFPKKVLEIDRKYKHMVIDIWETPGTLKKTICCFCVYFL